MNQKNLINQLYNQGKEIKDTFNKSFGNYSYDLTLGKTTNNLTALNKWLNDYSLLLKDILHLNEKSNLYLKIITAQDKIQFLNKNQFEELLDSLELINCLI